MPPDPLAKSQFQVDSIRSKTVAQSNQARPPGGLWEVWCLTFGGPLAFQVMKVVLPLLVGGYEVCRPNFHYETMLTILAFQPPIPHHETIQRTGARGFDPLPNVIRR